MPAAIIPFLRYWRAGLAGLALAMMLGLYVAKLRSDRALARCQAQTAALVAAVERQNAAVEAMRREGEARAQEQQQALSEARRRNEAQAPVIERLRRAAQRPQGPGCATPSELLEIEGL